MGVDLTTGYLGLTLKNPLIVAACPLTREIHGLEELEQAGAAAVVLYSLFAEQVDSDRLGKLGFPSSSSANGVSVMPLSNEYAAGLDAYLKNISLAKQAVSIPIIGSLNGSEAGDWVDFAKSIEQAGADALELNIYFVPTDPTITGSQIEEQYFETVANVRKQIKIPLSVKLGPFFSSLPNFAARLSALGIDGLVLFNRFMQPDIGVESFEVFPRLTLSTSAALRLPLRWIAILRPQLSLSLAASGGVHCGNDVVKYLLAGADVVSMASALLKNGPGFMTTVIEELVDYMNRKSFTSINEMRGLVMRQQGSDAGDFERANYIRTIISYTSDD